MSLLNSQVYAKTLGRLDPSLLNIVDHAPKSSLLEIVRTFTKQIEDGKDGKMHFLASLICDDQHFTDHLIDTKEAVHAYHVASEDNPWTEDMIIPIGEENAVLRYFLNQLSYTGTQLLYYPYTSDEVLALRIGNASCTIDPLSTPRQWFSWDNSTGVLTIKKWTSMRRNGEVEWHPTLPLFLYFLAQRTAAQGYSDAKTVMVEAMQLSPLFNSNALEQGYGLTSTLTSDLIESLNQSLIAYGEDVSEGKQITFTDQLQRGYRLVFIYDRNDALAAVLWNGNYATPLMFFDTNSQRRVNNVIYTTENQTVALPDFIKSLLISQQLNEFLVTCSDYIVNGFKDVTGLAQDLNSKASAWFEEVRLNTAKAIGAFRTGGILGLATYITGFATTLSTTSGDNSTGLFTFTDPSAWVPTTYIAGMLKTAAQAVSLIGVAIAAIGARIIGGIISIIGLITRVGLELFTTQWDQTKFQLVDDVDVIPLITPYVTHYGEFNVTSLGDADADFTSLFSQYVKVVGGYILFGPSQLTEAGTLVKIAWEFHPDIVDRTKLTYHMLNNLDLYKCISYSANSQVQALDYMFYPYWQNTEWLEFLYDHCDDSNYAFGPGNQSYPTEFSQDGYATDATNKGIPVIIINNATLFHLSMINRGNPESFADHKSTIRPTSVDGTKYWWNWISMGSTISPNEMSIGANILGCAIYWLHRSNSSTSIGLWLNDIALGGIAYYSAYVDEDLYVNPDRATATAEAVDYFRNWPYSNPTGFVGIIKQGLFAGEPKALPLSIKFALNTPSYTVSSFIAGVVLTATVAIVTTVTAVFTTRAVKMKVNSMRALANARVEKAWQDLAEDPTTANAEEYYKVAKRNNFISHFLGNEKMNVSGYWLDTGSGSTDTGNAITSFLGGEDGVNKFDVLSNDRDNVMSGSSDSIYEAITGTPLSVNPNLD